MKNVYRLGDDIFIAAAFVSFVIGLVLKVFEISFVRLGAGAVSPKGMFNFAAICLIFSIALSLHELGTRK